MHLVGPLGGEGARVGKCAEVSINSWGCTEYLEGIFFSAAPRTICEYVWLSPSRDSAPTDSVQEDMEASM